MKFIFADSIDVVDPNYNFRTDQYAHGRNHYWDDIYPHELFTTPPYDGILVSLATVGSQHFTGKYTESQRMRFLRVGAKEFLRLNKLKEVNIPVYGDCGAFTYSKSKEPPYSASDVAEFYSDGQFDYGCSVDHIIFEFLSSKDKKTQPQPQSLERFEITLQLAAEFIKESKHIGPHFEPIGVAQGWNAQSLSDSASKLIAMGYRYIAIGGLVPLKIEEIHEAVSAVDNVMKRHQNIKVHLLGFAKADNLEEFNKYSSIASFDSTSPLLRAFKDQSKNYWISGEDGELKYYSAIRVPQSLENRTYLNKIKQGQLSIEALQKKERTALENLRNYDTGSCDLETALNSVVDYSRPLYVDEESCPETAERKIASLMDQYRRTLSDKPWKSCNCEVCKSVSIEVVIFRSSNRNKRRGFHNLHVYHKHVSEKIN